MFDRDVPRQYLINTMSRFVRSDLVSPGSNIETIKYNSLRSCFSFPIVYNIIY